MQPGRELDALVAEKIGGWEVIRGRKVKRDDGTIIRGFKNGADCRRYIADTCPPFSTDSFRAMNAFERVSSRFHLRLNSPFTIGAPWFAGLTPIGMTGWNGLPDFEMPGETAAHAICLVLLKACDAEVPE